MCGIAGFLTLGEPPDAPDEALRRMTRALIHRGPDGEGFWVGDGVYLGHRRLSIIDVVSGAQPMVGPSGCVLVFNGEIYNYLDLRRELESQGVTFKTHSDSEVLLAAFERDGPACLDRFIGMFALAIWDPRRRSLFLARDRLGKKPLYYFLGKDLFAFASELKALLTLPQIRREVAIDNRAISDFLSLGYILSPKTIFTGIRRFPAAHYGWFDPAAPVLRTSEYWDLKSHVIADRETYDRRARETFRELFDDAVSIRLHADVPLGAFLSGGIDSASVVAMMARHAPEATRAFTVAFDEPSYDESTAARATARELNVDLTVLENPTGGGDLEALIWQVDEPFADTSMMPTYLINREARNHVTVALSGDGGDELLAGYSTYRADALHRYYGRLPKTLTGFLSWGATRLIRPTYRKVGWDYKLRQFSRAGGLSARRAHYWWRVIFSEAEKRIILSDEFLETVRDYDPFDSFDERFDEVKEGDFLSQALYVDMKTWLQDDILVKADRMSMAASLEVRSPFLDHRLVEFCARLAPTAKLAGGHQKIILKDTMTDLLPSSVIRRRKQGFGAPTREVGSCTLKRQGNADIFRTGFSLNPAAEDVTYKAFAFGALNHWLDMYQGYRESGDWKSRSDGRDDPRN